MALNIKSPEVEALAAEVSRLTGETKTEAIRRALQDRKRALVFKSGIAKGRPLRRFLEREVWPKVPRRVLGRKLPKREREAILGYGAEGV